MVAEGSVHDQLPCLQLRPESGGYFMPVDIVILRTVKAWRCGVRDHYIRVSIDELSVL
jgi:hypothetical protein